MLRKSLLPAMLAASCAAAGSAQAALVVSKDATGNVACASGVCTATAADAVLNVKDLKQLLKQGDLTIASGAAALDIRVAAKFDWTKPHRLTLDAFRSIAVTEAVTSQGTGGVTLVANDGGSGGDHTFTGQGKLAFWDLSSSLVIDGQSYMLTAGLADLASKVASNPSGRYALSANVDASLDGTYAHAPVTTPLSGTFEGLGHIIDKMKINGPTKSKLGLFEEIAAAGGVRDLKLANADVRNDAGGDKHGAGPLGTLAATSAGVIAHVSAAGVLHASGKAPIAGGLVGDNKGTIEDSSAAVSLSGGTNAISGGLVGWNENSIVSSSASGNVSVSLAITHGGAGGLAGENTGSIDASHASGAVKGLGGWNGDVNFTLQDLGGLVGHGGTISRSFATGSVTGGVLSRVGGLSGSVSTIADSYATGTLNFEGDGDIGGLIGSSGGVQIATSYSTAAVSAGGGTDKGGFIGHDSTSPGGLSNDYWDLDTSGISDPSQGAGNLADDPGITGLSDAALKAALPAGFDPAIWGQDAGINNGYPYLLANPPQ